MNFADFCRQRLKKAFLHVCKLLGCFAVARRLTRRGLRILGYHGFELHDEGQFRPPLFMDAAVFRERMEFLKRKGYPVVTLEEGVEGLRCDTLPDCATVITLDDGVYSTWKLAAPVLLELDLPGTIYVSTYYCIKPNPVFRLVVQYMFWKTTREELSLDGLGLDASGVERLSSEEAKDRFAWWIIDYGESQMHEEERVRLSEELGRRLGVDYVEIVDRRIFTLMTPDEIREAASAGVDIQLHTHRHVLPPSADGVEREIRENRAVLEPLVGKALDHFCYPSGIHYVEHLAPLAESGVASATTCERALNYGDANPLTLSRFLDATNVSWIEFEAEMSGFTDFLRKIAGRRRRPLASAPRNRHSGQSLAGSRSA